MKFLTTLFRSVPVLTAGIALMLSSCIKDDTYLPAPGGGEREVTFRIEAPALTDVTTRALGSQIENRITSLHLYLFDPSDKLVRQFHPTSLNVSSSNNRNTWSFTGSLPADGDTYSFVAIANKSMGTIATGTLKSAMKTSAGTWGRTPINPGTEPIPMYGEWAQTMTPATVSVTIPMYRMAARVNVTVATDAQTDFELQYVYLYNNETNGWVIPDAANFSGGAYTAPSLPPTSNKNTSGTRYTANDAARCIEKIYALETAHVASYGYDGWEKNPCIVVGGSYKKGTTTYYRLDFLGEAGRWQSILRNHSYNFEITTVNGEGFTSPSAALASAPRNIASSVVGWDDNDYGDIIIDGPSYMGIAPGELVFSNISQEAQQVTLKTNVPWEIGQRTTLPAWLGFNYGVGDYSEGKPVTIIASPNFTGQDRSCTVIFKSTDGRMSVRLKVTQKSVGVAVGSANCYMIKNPDTTPIVIDLSQVATAIGTKTSPDAGFLGSGWISDFSRLRAQMLWTDGPVSGGRVVESAVYNGATNLSDGRVIVTPGTAKGNALVILYQAGSSASSSSVYDASRDKIVWSWHIWNTDYHPYNSAGKAFASGENNKWMDRNLGALSNTPNSVETLGLMYQAGRKDPFPQAPSTTQANTTALVYRNWSYGTSSITYSDISNMTYSGANNLANSVQYPMKRFYSSATYSDWYTNSSYTQFKDLWGGEDVSSHPAFVRSSGKSVYDPCPEGYKVATYESLPSYITDWQSATLGKYNSKYGGYYPYGGYRDAYQIGMQDVGNTGYVWLNRPSSIGYSVMTVNDYTSLVGSMQANATALAVRCIVE